MQLALGAVLLVDDHRVFSDVLRLALEHRADVAEVAVAHTAREALARAHASGFDVAIVDLDLPDAGGVDVVGALRASHPDARIVVLTAHARPDHAERALRAGADAFLGKDGTLDRVLEAASRPRDGRPLVDVEPTGEPAALTPREHDVLRRLGIGEDPARIAADLGLSVHTVRGHIKTVMAKFETHSQLGAVVAAHRRGLISVGSRY